jgi:hypothetical protein
MWKPHNILTLSAPCISLYYISITQQDARYCVTYIVTVLVPQLVSVLQRHRHGVVAIFILKTQTPHGTKNGYNKNVVEYNKIGT